MVVHKPRSQTSVSKTMKETLADVAKRHYDRWLLSIGTAATDTFAMYTRRGSRRFCITMAANAGMSP